MATTTTIKAGESAKTITLNEGKALVLTGSAGAAGVAYLLDPVLGGTNSSKSWAVAAGAIAPIGPYSGTQKIQLTCSAGNIDATVQDAVLGTISAGSAVATITGTPGVNNTLTATLPAGIIGTLQWTRTTKAVPPVKSNISAAVANAVNSLTYQQQVADINCLIGCDASNQVSPSSAVDVPAGKPTAPTNVVATAGNGTISVTFGAPSSDGGATITSYTATDSATGDTVSGSGSPLNFTGRANGVARTISVVANNSAGAGAPGVSGSVTPSAADPAYAKTRAARSAVAAGTGYAKYGLVGNSTVAGFGSTGATPNRSGAVVVYLKAALRAAQGLPVLSTSYIGDQSFYVTNGLSAFTVDSRLSSPDGASYTAQTTRCAGGSMLAHNGLGGTSANRMGFLAEDPVDTFDIYYARNTGLGSTKVNRVGSAQGTFSGSGTPSAALKYTYTGVLSSTEPLYFGINSGNSYISGIDAYDSTTKSIRLYGIGWSGGRVADWIANSTGFDPLPSLLAMQLDLAIIRAGENDARTNSGLSAYSTNLTTLVDALIAAGTNVALATHFPFDPTVASQAQQALYAQATRDVAASRNLRVFDTFTRIGTYANAVAQGWVYDTLHPNDPGYQADTTLMAAFILSL